MSENRRKHERVRAQGPGTIVGTDGTERAFELIDLSEAGARLICESAIEAMTRVQVVLLLPADRLGHTQDARLDTVGVVVWSHPMEEAPGKDTPGKAAFDTGVFFPELDEASAGLLRNFVATAV